MRIVNLLDDYRQDKMFSAAHGLSLYIEFEGKKILFDLGPNNYYKKNAQKMNIDLTDVDYLFISHGHNDHGTGIKQFLKYNSKAEVYLSSRAFEDHVKKVGRKYEDIGIGRQPKTDRIHFIQDEHFSLTDSIHLCDMVKFEKHPIGDKNLMTYEDGQYVEDHFHHEIYLVLQENGKNVLITGCSHRGIENIIDSIEKNLKDKITHVVGGLHFVHYDSFNLHQTDYLQKVGKKLKEKKNVQIYACHCTGEDAYFELKQTLKENLNKIQTGSIIEI